MPYYEIMQVSIVGVVYLVGYMQWSVAWLIGPVILSVLRDQWRKESEYRRNLAKTAALSSEKDVVLARLDDLPAWVSDERFIDSFIKILASKLLGPFSM